MSKTVYSFESSDKTSAALDQFLEKASSEAITKHGKFTVAFSGGSLPATVCKYLRANKSIDFSRWYVFWADERCVPLGHEDSNYRLVKEELLDYVNIPPEQVVAINESLVDIPSKAADDYQLGLGSVFNEFPEFDLILLGIGPDGHTCSLFPGFAQIEEKDRWVVHIEDSPKPPSSRITLTLPVLNRARNVAFVAGGKGKQEMVKRIVDDTEEGLPAARVVPAKGHVYWFVDDAAAKELSINKPAKF